MNKLRNKNPASFLAKLHFKGFGVGTFGLKSRTIIPKPKLRETDISPENHGLEDEIPFGMAVLQWPCWFPGG